MNSNYSSLNSMPSITQSVGSAVSLEELKVSDVKQHLQNCKKFLADYKSLCQQSKQFTQNANLFIGSFQDVINGLPVYEYSNGFEEVKECFKHMIKAQERFTQVIAALYVPLRQDYQTQTANVKQTDAHYKELKEKLGKKVVKLEKKLNLNRSDTGQFGEVLQDLKENASALESIQQQHAEKIINSTLEQTANFLDVFVVFMHLHKTVCIPSMSDNVDHHLDQLNRQGITPNPDFLKMVMENNHFSPKARQLLQDSLHSAKAQETMVKRETTIRRMTNPNLFSVIQLANRVRSRDTME
eukprot:NODE_244_length_13037_cov_0.560442.p4 type:complete len:298 gc:universal NODE_244_length_13037_cov_0.560442:8044-8937(+)